MVPKRGFVPFTSTPHVMTALECVLQRDSSFGIATVLMLTSLPVKRRPRKPVRVLPPASRDDSSPLPFFRRSPPLPRRRRAAQAQRREASGRRLGAARLRSAARSAPRPAPPRRPAGRPRRGASPRSDASLSIGSSLTGGAGWLF